ncbi:MAG: hypothetical protein U1E45_05960 [Geminicoccaceae bacterium]
MTGVLTRGQLVVLALAAASSAGAGLLTGYGAPAVLTFAVAAVALATLAATVGEATDQLSAYMGPAATGILQSAIGNLPELFVCIFALRAGLVAVVQASLIGSILANALLVLGLAFVVGNVRGGRMRFESRTSRMIAVLLLLAVSAMILPTLAAQLHLPAGSHEPALAVICALVLLAVFATSVRAMLGEGERVLPEAAHAAASGWPLGLAIGVLVVTGIGAAFVSEWFVAALEPAIEALGISQAFAGLVIVAIAGNAVENVVGIQLAAQGKADYAVSVILNSALQIAVALVPILILVSFFVGGAPVTLALPPVLAIAVALTAILVTVITVDGEADEVEGAALIGLYVLIAAVFWWG